MCLIMNLFYIFSPEGPITEIVEIWTTKCVSSKDLGEAETTSPTISNLGLTP